MPKVFSKLFLLSLFFIYIYSLHFKGLPFNCNIILGCIGGMIYLWDLLCLKDKCQTIYIRKNSIYILLSLLFLLFLSLFSMVYNGTSDINIIKTIIIDIIYVFAVYLLVKYVRKIYGNTSFFIIAKYLTAAVTLQMILALLISFEPAIKEVLLSSLMPTENVASAIERLDGTRLIGFGTAFFTSGVINSFTLLVIAVVLRNFELKFGEYVFFVYSFVLIFGVGMMLARTTIVGMGLAVMYFIFTARWFVLKQVKKSLKACSLLFLLVVVVGFSLSEETRAQFQVMSNFGFELFNNYLKSGELTTSSTRSMMYMYRFPEDIKTWIIGDGYFENPYMPGYYYMRTDIGFLRLIYYFGLLGLFGYTLFQFVTIYQTWKNNNSLYTLFFLLCFLLYVILSLKGMTDVFMFITLFYFIDRSKVKSIII